MLGCSWKLKGFMIHSRVYVYIVLVSKNEIPFEISHYPDSIQDSIKLTGNVKAYVKYLMIYSVISTLIHILDQAFSCEVFNI